MPTETKTKTATHKPNHKPKPYQELAPEDKLVAMSIIKKNEAEAMYLAKQAEGEQLLNKSRTLQNEKYERESAIERSIDINNRILDFTDQVGRQSVHFTIQTLSVWARQNDRPITIRFNSPGGSVIEGFALFDYIRSIAARDRTGKLLNSTDDPAKKATGVFVTTTTMGMAASMAGVLLQAGNRRVVAPNAWVLIHEVSGVSWGSTSQQEDEVQFTKRLQERLVDILTERSTVTRSDLKKFFKRKDFWIDADEVMKHGLADAKGYI